MSKNLFLYSLLTMMLCAMIPSLHGFELDRLFPQKISSQDIEALKENPDRERAVFLTYAQARNPIVVYLSYRRQQNRLLLRGNLPPEGDRLLSSRLIAAERELFAPVKANGTPLYRHGSMFKGHLRHNNNDIATWIYVPYRLGNMKNNAFISDLGYFELLFSPPPTQPRNFIDELLKCWSSGELSLCRQVKLNRYFLFKENFWGPCDYFAADSISDAMQLSTFMPNHKVTMNKNISDWSDKQGKDQSLFFKILCTEEYLLSQDHRLKLGLVPGWVKLNFQRIEHTDIGSGQNHLVFLSLGPGINYFDDPWKKPRRNLPGPRLIFIRPTLAFAQIQLFPTYSIEPEGLGEKRLQTINSFQSKSAKGYSSCNPGPEWFAIGQRRQMIKKIEDAVCLYGLCNDSDELTPGFSLLDQEYRGNVINNEVRIKEGVSLPSLLAAVIVPPKASEDYQNQFVQLNLNRNSHWQFIAGTHFKNLFLSASTADDKGFRAAWLYWHLQFSHPLLHRIISRARSQEKVEAELKIADSLSRIISRTGTDFFVSGYFLHRRSLETRKLLLWCAYLESFRNQSPDRLKKLQDFIDFHNEFKDMVK